MRLSACLDEHLGLHLKLELQIAAVPLWAVTVELATAFSAWADKGSTSSIGRLVVEYGSKEIEP
jgi:hypothetical protein